MNLLNVGMGMKRTCGAHKCRSGKRQAEMELV